MKWLKKVEPAKATSGDACTGCGMTVSDPTWRICPRCRAELAACVGCRSCGKCSK